MGVTVRLSALAILFALLSAPVTSQDFGDTDSSRAVIREQLSRLSSKELEARKARRRWVQQRGYTDVLIDVVRRDGLNAIISYLRMVARLELALPQDQLHLYIPVRYPDRVTPGLPGFTGRPSGPIAVPLHEPKGFPVDPWGPQPP